MTKSEQYLSAAWEEYSKVVFVQSLGSCIRRVCPQMQSNQHSILNKLDGSVALAYFEQHYKENH